MAYGVIKASFVIKPSTGYSQLQAVISIFKGFGKQGYRAVVDDLRNIFDALNEGKRTTLDQNNAGALFDWVKQTSQHFGLKEAPRIVHIDHTLPMAYGGFERAKGGDWISKVYINEGALKHVFDSPNLATHVPDGLKAFIGHEMSHVVDGVKHIQMSRLPVFAVPVLSLVGYELYKEAKKHHQFDPAKSLAEHLDNVTEEQKSKARSPFEVQSLDIGRRLAVVGGGLIVGGAIASHMAISSEFRADRMGVLASGNAEAFITSLTKLEKSMEAVFAPQVKQWTDTISKRSFMENTKQVFGLLKQAFEEMTHGAHPETQERFAAIRAFAKEQGMLPRTL